MSPDPENPSSSALPLGRKRTRNHDLPPRMARKGQSYYYVTNELHRQWIPLGQDLERAKRLWAHYECRVAPTSVAELVHRYIDGLECADGTRKQYKSYARAIEAAFPFPADELRAPHVALWRDDNKHRAAYINGCLAVIRSAYRKGREWGLVEHDPGVAGFDVQPRDRYLADDEFVAIRAHAPCWLALAMDLAHLTGARPSDLRAMRWDQVLPDALVLRQQKTKIRQAFTMTEELAQVFARARARPLVGLYVVANDKGRPIGPTPFGEAWREACRAAGVANAQFRDIRAKYGTDAQEDGQDYQAGLGHTTRAMSERYLRKRRTVKAAPLRRKL